MPLAALLLREATPSSLATLVSRSQHLPPPHPSYDLQLSPTHFSFTPLKPETPDEGFESDIDSLSIVSNGSYETKTAETDSANGSASSDSDTETPEPARTVAESYNLVDCVCYNDVTYPDVLLFVIKGEALVFRFDELNNLKNFYLNFTALKAVTNQKAYNKSGGKFNLLQRTDNNGVTHIEITREPELAKLAPPVLVRNQSPLRKVWSSADDLLATPKRPDRKKKVKGKAPPPPQQAPPGSPPSADVMRGEYVRVNVNTDAINKDFIAKSQLKEKKPKANLATLFIPKPVKSEAWTNSVPRLLKKHRSRSETRCFTPMAYRYIDTAPSYSPMGERLFGLSSKLKDFGEGRECRWNSGGDLSYKEGNLKSVIKKEEGRKKNEKKVTFSAYTTVQVV
ncbi:hypothetical protein Zmor_001063 [Zophobas morio]|uniref:Uncharacterized protein n=1 Tax=Zophobas morio TaxID=2755281 RepID=A0AA38MS58_9CUCU|nr:hypothetical protein Zmor_001063 [Zophobas morio]